MEVKQIYTLVNSLAAQAYGDSAVVATDLTGLVSMGDIVLSSATNTDAFLGVLVDRIGRVIVSERVYKSDTADLIRNTFDYGVVMQKLTVMPSEAKLAPQWELVEGQSVDQYIVNKPIVKQKLFGGLTPWEYDTTIPDVQLKSAFTSPEAMGAFISAIFLAVSNSMESHLERVGETAVANFAAEKIYAQAQTTASGVHCVHLLQEYHSETGNNALTAAAAMRDLDFIKFATMEITLYAERMTKMSKLFNIDGFVRFTPRDRLRVAVLANFAAATDAYLQADTYHNEFVALPHYRRVMYWQGSGQEWSNTECSTIDVTTSAGHVVKQNGVVAILNDIEAIGMTVDNRRSRTSPPNGRGEYTNYFDKADVRYYNDLSENGIVFTVSDTPFAITGG